ncbi:hypothetical protein PybrP1_009566 [[Pythium] brassicae (nom. inval.)]|nr:hypothetical protein PybrP1_009566 [[Pythium] brassicae (nom. inval.)]
MLVVMPREVSIAHVAAALFAIAVASVIVPLVSSIRRKQRIAKLLEPIPGPKGWFLLGILPELSRNLHGRLHEFEEGLMLQYGGRVNQPWNIFSTNSIFLSDPEDIKHIMSTKFANYIKSDAFLNAFSDLFGKSFFGLNHAGVPDNGAMWRLQRKVVMRVFTTNNLRTFSENIFHKYADKMVEIAKAQGGKVNIAELSSQYALQSIFDVLCGVPLEEVDAQLGLSFVDSMSYIANNIFVRMLEKPYFKYLWWCMPSEYRLQREARVMYAIADSVLEKRLNESTEEIDGRPDIMSRFIRKARELRAEGDADAEGVSVLGLDTLRSIFLTFNSAGWDTTSSVITYTLYTLVLYPEVKQKLFKELQTITKADLTFDGIKKLPYLDAVVNETLRLYPTVPLNQREAAEDDILPDGTFIPAGTTIFFSSWYMGRHNPVFGENRDKFCPERWLTMEKRPSAYDFPVFLAGSRICPGMNMGLTETKIFVATIVSQFDFEMQEGEQLLNRGYLATPNLTMKDGLPLQLTPRKVPAF